MQNTERNWIVIMSVMGEILNTEGKGKAVLRFDVLDRQINKL